MGKKFKVIYLVASLLLLLMAVRDFNKSQSWLEVFKAIFWLFVGTVGIWNTYDIWGKWGNSQ